MVFLETSKKDKLVDTMQATLITRNKTERAVDIRQMYTTKRTQCDVEVDLIFLKLFGFGFIETGDFHDGKYIVHADVSMSY
jgi:hypothetical protein